MDDLYRELLLEHYKHPQNKGRLKKGDTKNHIHTTHDSNPLCGDEITVDLQVKDGKVADVRFDGSGCALTVAAASLLTEKIKGMDMKEILSISQQTVLDLMGLKQLTPVRIKCAMLPAKAIKLAIMDASGRNETKNKKNNAW